MKHSPTTTKTYTKTIKYAKESPTKFKNY